MLKLYSPKKAERIIARLAPLIDEISTRFALPGACLRAILYQEITNIDLFDPLVDLLVQRNQRRGVSGSGPLQRSDSSTGYAQIFAFVAINAVNFAADRGLTSYAELSLPSGRRLDPASLPDIRLVWGRLHRDEAFNLTAAALNLLSAADEKTGRIDFPGYTPEEMKLIFTRYNGTVPRITPYGEAVYGHYQRYLRA